MDLVGIPLLLSFRRPSRCSRIETANRQRGFESAAPLKAAAEAPLMSRRGQITRQGTGRVPLVARTGREERGESPALDEDSTPGSGFVLMFKSDHVAGAGSLRMSPWRPVDQTTVRGPKSGFKIQESKFWADARTTKMARSAYLLFLVGATWVSPAATFSPPALQGVGLRGVTTQGCRAPQSSMGLRMQQGGGDVSDVMARLRAMEAAANGGAPAPPAYSAAPSAPSQGQGFSQQEDAASVLARVNAMMRGAGWTAPAASSPPSYSAPPPSYAAPASSSAPPAREDAASVLARMNAMAAGGSAPAAPSSPHSYSAPPASYSPAPSPSSAPPATEDAASVLAR